MHTINITTDELSYMLELINNERYSGNTNVVIAETLMALLHDASWHCESGPLPNDEEIDAQIAYASRTQ